MFLFSAVLLLGISQLVSCTRNQEEAPLEPPPTDPLARDFIGYGVVNASFTHVENEAGQKGVSLGYLRKGSLVKIIERRSLTDQENVELWILIEADYQGAPNGKIQGWLRESTVEVYDNERRALTASETMTP
ncbi:hypothetical protein FACS189447_10510 [Spirochaetia bacterium]|nr:hypothetical protein FACS189447_10510 [Spirochaetia bacterium]